MILHVYGQLHVDEYSDGGVYAQTACMLPQPGAADTPLSSGSQDLGVESAVTAHLLPCIRTAASQLVEDNLLCSEQGNCERCIHSCLSPVEREGYKCMCR